MCASLNNPITADVFKEDKSLAQKSEGLQRISFLPLVKFQYDPTSRIRLIKLPY